MKKYILKPRAKFQKALSPETEKYYNSLKRLNGLKVKKRVLKRYKANDLREALWKANRHTYWRKYWAKRRLKERLSQQSLALLVVFYVLFLVVAWLISH